MFICLPELYNHSREMLSLIEKDIEYSNKIINDLLDYSREMQLELTKTTPKSMIRDALAMIRVPRNIKVQDMTQNKPLVKVDVEKMKRVLINVIKNAVDAMPKGGKLTFRSRRIAESFELTFTDTGVGMSKDVLNKIWTPLFTTKAKGMGFGLSICKRMVEAHGGKLDVESSVNKGTTVKVIIPLKPRIEGGERIWIRTPESSLLTTTKA